MNSNNSQKYVNKNDNRIVYINSKEALRNIDIGNYKEAIRLYELNIVEFNDSLSKVKLAELYLEGKTDKINNNRARTLLKDAYKQDCKEARPLLAYMLANGIGGKKDKNAAYSMFLDELKENNPDAMVYIELCKLIPRKKNTKKVIKSLKQCITVSEKIKYRRKVSIDKFNNTRLGQIVNKLPNKISTKLDYLLDYYNEEKLSNNLWNLYEKANQLYKTGNYETARRIYKRLANYGDFDSKINYAAMCVKAIGGKKDIDAARNIYEDILDYRDEKLNKIENQISYCINKVECLKLDEKRKKKAKIIKEIKKEIIYLARYRQMILKNPKYEDVYLEYGLLLANNYSNEYELKDGIDILKAFAKNGEYIVRENKRLTKYGKAHNRRARVAAMNLGKLYEEGIWKPEDIDAEKAMFSKFISSKISGYTSYIVDKMNGKKICPIKTERMYKQKKCKVRFEIGTLCELLHINSWARKMYESMYRAGDFRGTYTLAKYEQYGKGGIVDCNSAIKHYRAFLRSTVNSEDKSEKKMRYYAVNNLGNLYEKQNDIISAVEAYKIAANQGNSQSKNALKKLYKEGKWVPENSIEYKWIKPKFIDKVSGKIKQKNILISKIPQTRIDLKKPVATAISFAVGSCLVGDTAKPVTNKFEKYPNTIKVTDQNIEHNYLIGDKVSVLKDNIIENSTIVGMVAYNPISESVLDENIELSYEKYGLSSEKYIDTISKLKSINKQSIKLLYCLKNGEDIKWINPDEEKMFIAKSYKDIKKEEDYKEYLV